MVTRDISERLAPGPASGRPFGAEVPAAAAIPSFAAAPGRVPELDSSARLQSFLAHLKCLLPLDLVERPLGVPKPSLPEVSEALAGEQVASRRIGSVWVDRAFLPPTL